MSAIEKIQKAIDKRTGRTLLMALSERFEVKCNEEPAFAEAFEKKVEKYGADTALARCMQHVTAAAKKYLIENYPEEMKNPAGFGADVPDDYCLEAADEYFMLEVAPEDEEKKPAPAPKPKTDPKAADKKEKPKKASKSKTKASADDGQSMLDLISPDEDTANTTTESLPSLEDFTKMEVLPEKAEEESSSEIPFVEDSVSVETAVENVTVTVNVEENKTANTNDSDSGAEPLTTKVPFPDAGLYDDTEEEEAESEEECVMEPNEEPVDNELEGALNTVLSVSTDKGKSIRELLDIRDNAEKKKALLKYFAENPRILKLDPKVANAAKVILQKNFVA